MTRIAVIGAGLMGHGIALTFARAGHAVALTDPDAKTLQSAPDRICDSLRLLGAEPANIAHALLNVTQADDLSSAVQDADVIFEAAPEKLPLKQAIFAEVEVHAPQDAVLASNTSVIPITQIMKALTGRHRALGTHWWNPPHMIPLVEVIKTEWTDPAKADQMHALLATVGKTPVMVEKDVPGFIGNRLQHALWREAISLVENGICSAQGVAPRSRRPRLRLALPANPTRSGTHGHGPGRWISRLGKRRSRCYQIKSGGSSAKTRRHIAQVIRSNLRRPVRGAAF